MRRTFLVPLLLLGCNQDVSLTETSVCDGELQRDEGTVDAPFDGDGDGFFDATNPGCIATYAAEDLDCDDNEPDVHPGAVETVCNGLDDDCDELTVDHQDEDDDGADSCSDCDDRDAERRPQNSEIACNGIDDDCDEATPDECAYDYSGTYTVSPKAGYTCAYGYVAINFDSFVVTHFDPNITFAPNRGSQPPTMAGTVSDTGSFYASKSLPGSCTEDYEIIGSFTSETEFSATFNVKFSGGSGACFDCVNKSWTITGTK